MKSTKRPLVLAVALSISALGLACTESTDNGNSGGSGGRGGTGGSTGGRGGSGGSTGGTGGSGGATGGTGGSTGGTGGSTGGTGGSTGGTGGSTGGTGGSTGGTGGSTGGTGGSTGGTGGSTGGTGGSSSDGGRMDRMGDGSGSETATGAKVVLTVTGFTMGPMGRNCYPAGSNSMGNKSPKMDWGPAPAGIKSWVLSTEDITGRSVHQIVCKIPADVLGQPADVKTMVPAGAEWGVGHGNKATVGWYGPGASGAARNYEIRIWALGADLPMSCKTDPKGALAYLKTNRMNKAVVIDTDGKDFWGNVNGACQ